VHQNAIKQLLKYVTEIKTVLNSKKKNVWKVNVIVKNVIDKNAINVLKNKPKKLKLNVENNIAQDAIKNHEVKIIDIVITYVNNIKMLGTLVLRDQDQFVKEHGSQVYSKVKVLKIW